MNQVANYSQTDWTLWYSGLPNNKVLCKSRTITPMQQVVDTNKYQQINLTDPVKGNIYTTVQIAQNIYIFDSDVDADNHGQIMEDFPPETTSYNSNPCVLMKGKYMKVVCGNNATIAEVVLHPFSYVGVVDPSETYDLKMHSFGDNLSNSNLWVWVIVFIIIAAILAAVGFIIFHYRLKIKEKFL